MLLLRFLQRQVPDYIGTFFTETSACALGPKYSLGGHMYQFDKLHERDFLRYTSKRN